MKPRCATFVVTLVALLGTLCLSGCVTSAVDQMVFNAPAARLQDEAVVILGRRHASNYDTEPDFVSCVGDYVSRRDSRIQVIDEVEFLNALYPWFEPRTAPVYPQDLSRLLARQPAADKLKALRLRYMIWVDGTTERTDQAGSMACGISMTGAACFGFGTWNHDSNYETTIWDIGNLGEVGRISATASGRSYMPAVVIPIPIIAPVQGTACDGLGEQLLQFLSSAP